MVSPAFVVFLITAPVFADTLALPPETKEFVDPVILKERADALRDAVANPSFSDITIKERGRGLFGDISEKPLVVAVGAYRRMERETGITGKLGSIEGMEDAASRRIAEWRRTHKEPPPPDVESAVAQSRALREGKRIGYDGDGMMADNQMGTFKYLRGTIDAGLVKLNERMKILGALVGEAFTYATVSHEAQHARDHAAGRLSSEAEVAGELSAFRVQYLWLKLMDPSGERMLTLHAALKLRMLREPDDEIKEALNSAVVYLEHLSDVVATNGKNDELLKLIKKLGYSDDHKHDHDDGHKEHGAVSPTRA